MGIGTTFAPEWKDFIDPQTGVSLRQLTNYKSHSHHLYFTNPGWYAGGSKLLFGSDRFNRTNLFGLDLASGEITQLTDLEAMAPPYEVELQHSSVNPLRDEAYFWYGRRLAALDLNTCDLRILWEAPEKYRLSMTNVTADGKYVCVGIFQDLSDRFSIDYMRGYVGFAETWEARPHSQVLRIAVDGSGAEVVWEEDYWIGHVNTSPTQAHLLTFCHEGPWQKVDNRIWSLDMNTGKAWVVRPRESQERMGHEYWHADGIYLGYHGAWQDGRKFFGRIRYDNTDQIEVAFPHETGHIHSNTFDLIVGDGGRVVRLWKWNGEGFDGPRVLCEHRSSMHIQQVHVHPRFTPDGRQVVFTSDVSGYGNLYLAPVPDFDTLPHVQEGR